jgi:hypothetical protein
VFGCQDITQAGQADGALIESSANLTSRSIPSALITLAVRGSNAIFGRPSASGFFIEVEQLSVMHFLDSIRFQNVLGLIRSNSAYIVSNNAATGRPHIEFTQVSFLNGSNTCSYQSIPFTDDP